MVKKNKLLHIKLYFLTKRNWSWGYRTTRRIKYLRSEKIRLILYRYFKDTNFSRLGFLKLFLKLKYKNQLNISNTIINLPQTTCTNKPDHNLLYKNVKVNITNNNFLFKTLLLASVYKIANYFLYCAYLNYIKRFLKYYFQNLDSPLFKKNVVCHFKKIPNILCYNPTYFKTQPPQLIEKSLFKLLDTTTFTQIRKDHVFNTTFLFNIVCKYCFIYVDNLVDKISLVWLLKTNLKFSLNAVLQHLKNFLFFYDWKFLEVYGLKFLEYIILFNISNLFYLIFGFKNKFKNYLNSNIFNNKNNKYKEVLKNWLKNKQKILPFNTIYLIDNVITLVNTDVNLNQYQISKIHNINSNTYYRNYLNTYKTKNFIFDEILDFYTPKWKTFFIFKYTNWSLFNEAGSNNYSKQTTNQLKHKLFGFGGFKHASIFNFNEFIIHYYIYSDFRTLLVYDLNNTWNFHGDFLMNYISNLRGEDTHIKDI